MRLMLFRYFWISFENRREKAAVPNFIFDDRKSCGQYRYKINDLLIKGKHHLLKMKFMKLGTRPDTFYTEEATRYIC